MNDNNGVRTSAGLGPTGPAPWLLAVATTLALRAGRGYRPFPSVDDFAYMPIFRHAIDVSQYRGDFLVEHVPSHLAAWVPLIWIGEATATLPLLLFIATLVLSFGTVLAALRILQSLGVSGWLLPLMALPAFAGKIVGVGRGAVDGAFGDAFHAQWAGLCLLLWAYDAFLGGKSLRAGVLLGLATVAHPAVGLQGAAVVFLATLLTVGRPLPAIRRLAIACAAVSLPITLPLVWSFASHRSSPPSWPVERIVDDGYLYRMPHEYVWDLHGRRLMGGALMAVSGLSGLCLLRQLRPSRSAGGAAALVLGHGLLVGASAIVYGPLRHASVLPYVLTVNRTSPLLVVLLCALCVAGLEVVLSAPSLPRTLRLPSVAHAITVGFLCLLFVRWQQSLLCTLLAGVLLAGLVKVGSASDRALFAAGGAYLLMGTAAFAGSLSDLALESRPTTEEAELYRFCREKTSSTDAFVVPPGLQGFRFHAGRPIYTDFKSFPSGSPGMIPEWRHRLDDIAPADDLASELRGWSALEQLERCYGVANTPARIADLLLRTGMRYFVWDASALEIPPYCTPVRAQDPRLRIVFRSARFTVYELARDRH